MSGKVSLFLLLLVLWMFSLPTGYSIKLTGDSLDYVSFWISPEEEKDITTELKLPNRERVSCTFSYNTNRHVVNKPEASKIIKKSPEELLKPFSKTPCIIENSDSFDHGYEICLERTVNQAIGKNFQKAKISLGKFVGWITSIDGPVQKYEGGSSKGCTKRGAKEKERSTKIKFICHEKNKLELYSIEEPITCEYIITIATDVVCGHPDFGISTAKFVSETWTMEMTNVVNEGVTISVQPDSDKKDNLIEDFSIGCTKYVNNIGKSVEISSFAARYGDRKPLPDEMLHMQSTEISASVISKYDFNFLSITLEE